MNPLLAALMMLGPWASVSDELNVREAFAWSLFTYSISASGPMEHEFRMEQPATRSDAVDIIMRLDEIITLLRRGETTK